MNAGLDAARAQADGRHDSASSARAASEADRAGSAFRLDAVESDRCTSFMPSIVLPRVSFRAYERAAAILAEGRGTHFDPDVIDAFLANQERFREIAARFVDAHGGAAPPHGAG